MKVFTLGYEKRSITEYIQILQTSKVKILIDVRETAWSYKRDFCKTKFSAALEEGGIKYIHVKELGNPKKFRSSERKVSDILRQYKRYLKTTESGIDSLLALFAKAKQHNINICLTCFERDHKCCHRSIITDHLKSSITTANIIHL